MNYYASNITRAFSNGLEHSSVTGNDDLFFLSNSNSSVYNDTFSSKALDTLSPSEFYTGNFMSKNLPYAGTPNGSSTIPANSYYNARNWNNNLRVIDDDEQFERTTENATESPELRGAGSGSLGDALEGSGDRGSSEGNEDNIATEEDASAESIEGTEAILETGEAAEATNPWGIAAIINQQLGSAVNEAMTTRLSNEQTADYQQNINQHGVNVGLNADLIRQNEQQTISTKSSAGAIGSFFGPLGALIGQSLSGNSQPNQNVLNTANSFIGQVNPTDTGISGAASTSAASGISSMTDSVDSTST